MSRTALIPTTFLVVLGSVGPATAIADEGWRRPVPGGVVVAPFTYERAAPYEPGRRRGIDLRGRAGSPVLAVCDGTVAYAGRVPRFGRGVTLRCGALVATELGLSRTLVARGRRVARGEPLGLLGPSGTLRLGARRASDTKAYINPEPLLTDQPPQLAPLPPLHRPRAIRPRRLDPPGPATSSPPMPMPWPVVGGAAVLASAALGGTTLRVRRRRQRRRFAVAQGGAR